MSIKEQLIDIDDAWKMTEKNIVVRLPVIQHDDPEFIKQFENRYSIYCNDPYNYEEIDFDVIAQLAHDLGAINGTIARRIGAFGQSAAYLTADKFLTIQDQLDQGELQQLGNKDSDGMITYLIDIKHSCFYSNFPLLFWKKESLFENHKWKNAGEVFYTKKVEETVSTLDQNIKNQEALIELFEEEVKKSNPYKCLEFAKNYLQVLKNQKKARDLQEITQKVKEFDDLIVSIQQDKEIYLKSKNYHFRQVEDFTYWVHESILDQWDLETPIANHYLVGERKYPQGTVIEN